MQINCKCYANVCAGRDHQQKSVSLTLLHLFINSVFTIWFIKQNACFLFILLFLKLTLWLVSVFSLQWRGNKSVRCHSWNMSHRQIIFILYICVNFTALICVSAQNYGFNEKNDSNYTLPVYAIASRADLLNSTCGKELRDFRDAVNQRILWSLRS